MNRLYWIDDDFEQVFYVVQGAIKKLWKLNEEEEGIHSKIFLFGNAYESVEKDEVFTQEDETKAFMKLRKLFVDGCMSIDGPDKNRPVYNVKKDLIQDSVCCLYKREVPGDSEAYLSMKKKWVSGKMDSIDSDDYKDVSGDVESLVKKMNIKPKSVVGIDILLLHEDMDRLRDNKLILSMELYHRLSNDSTYCFLYSSDAGDDELRQNWKNKYKSFYTDNDREITIYKRTDVMQKGNVVREIEKMFENIQKDTKENSDGNKNFVE